MQYRTPLIILFSIATLPLSAATRSPALSAEDAYQAVEHNDISLVRSWLATKPEEVSIKESELNLLHVASSLGFNEIVQLLLNAGYDLNGTTVSGDTPLHFAARNANPETVKLLLARGANQEIKNSAGTTAHGEVTHMANVLSLAPKPHDQSKLKERKEIETRLEKTGAIFKATEELRKYVYAPAPDAQAVKDALAHGAVVTPEIMQDAKNKLINAERNQEKARALKAERLKQVIALLST
jgi:hypothetical protein